jgi:homoaconitase/3-isopropylmalate dehydratase large subunit
MATTPWGRLTTLRHVALVAKHRRVLAAATTVGAVVVPPSTTVRMSVLALASLLAVLGVAAVRRKQ